MSQGTVLKGPALDLFRSFERLFLRLAARWNAAEVRYPPLIPVRHLVRAGYVESFPHLLTLPVSVPDDPESVDRFRREAVSGDGASLVLPPLGPVRDALVPAACYPVYAEHEGARLEAPVHVTVQSTCFRRESEHASLERERAFTMREIVCVGSRKEVRAFVAEAVERAGSLAAKVGVPIEWQEATDPFFKPLENPGYLLQKAEPVKREMVFANRLALGSVNDHREAFGRGFDIQRAGAPAWSACLAFGIERWTAAGLETFGRNPATWPSLDALDV